MPSPLEPDSDAISDPLVITNPADAAQRLVSGGVVALPTETVYGLAASADHPAAIARVFAIKGRPETHPLILHIGDPNDLPTWVTDIPEDAARLAAACWPGPLTLLLNKSDRVSDVITGGRSTVAIRVPAHDLAQQVLSLAGPWVAPSANRFGHVSPTTCAHVLADLKDFLDPATDAVLDGGPCTIGVESTIVDCTVSPAQILRHGGITSEEIHRLLAGRVDPASGPERASGMLVSHYAPHIPVTLCETDEEVREAQRSCAKRGLLAAVVDHSEDLVVYARDLYSLLRAAETAPHDVIIARLPAAEGLGHAIRDRLRKAAAPRPC
jgi:L-threonylcarbamoyladenylate synthase